MKYPYCLLAPSLILLLTCLNPSIAKIETTSIEFELMNEIDGVVTICLPDEKPQDRLVKYIDDFFKVYKFDDELTEFVLELQKDFGDENAVDNPLEDPSSSQMTFDEVLADPRFGAFEKIVKIYDDPGSRSLAYNISKFYNLKASPCKFAGDKYVSGGIQIEVRGYRASNDPANSDYILVDKKAELIHQKLPIPNSYSTTEWRSSSTNGYYLSELNNEYRSLINKSSLPSDCLGTKEQKKKANFFSENNLDYARILKNEVFSMRLAVPLALNCKLRDGKSFSGVSIEESSTPALLDFRLSRFMYCSPELHLAGFCNMDIPGKKSAEEFATRAFSKGYSDTFENQNHYKTTDPIFLDFEGLTAGLSTQIVSKTGGVNPQAELQVRGKTYDGLIVIGDFNLTKGNNLAKPNIINYPQITYAKDLNYASISEDETREMLDSIFVTSIIDSGSNAGVPFIRWIAPTAIDQTAYYKYAADGGYKVFRNGVEIAQVSSKVTSYSDSQFTTLKSGTYVYSIAPVNSLGEYLVDDDIRKVSFVKITN